MFHLHWAKKERKSIFFFGLLNTKLDSLLTHLEVMSLSLSNQFKGTLRVGLHQASASMLRQLCDDASDTVLIENNGAAWEWVATPI